MLPWPRGVAVANRDFRAALESAHTIGKQTIQRPVAAADDIAGAGASQRDLTIAIREERFTIRSEW